MTLTSAAHLPHVCCRTNGFIVQDLWCWNKSTRPKLATIHETERGRIPVHVGIGELDPWLTHILRRPQDLPHFCDIVHAPGQAEVHNTNVSQRSGTGQQDVLGLEKTDYYTWISIHLTSSTTGGHNCEGIYFKIQVHHAIPMQEGHSGQDLLGQPDHIFLCKGLVIICNTLVEDFSPSSTVNTEGVRKVRTRTLLKWLMWPSFKGAFLSRLVHESWREVIPVTLFKLTIPKSFPFL